MNIETSQIIVPATDQGQPQRDNEFIRSTEYERKFRFQAESESLLNNLAALRQTVWEMRAKIYQLDRVVEESRNIKAEVGLLRAQIDSMAVRMGLQPMLARTNEGLDREARE